MKTITVLAHDPGVRSYGYCILSGTLKNKKLKVLILRNGTVDNTVTQIKSGKLLKKEIASYVKEIRQSHFSYKPTFFVAERFMTRGIKGTLIECVATMLGAVIHDVSVNPMKTLKGYSLIPAVTWKNEIGRWGIDLKELYKKTRVTPHQVDAMFMGIYAMSKILKVQRSRLPIKRLLRALEATSTRKLINRRV